MKIPFTTNAFIKAGFSLDRLQPGFYKYPKAERQNNVMTRYSSETSAQLFGIYISYVELKAIF